MATDRRAEVTWNGSLMEGSGTIDRTQRASSAARR